MQNETTNGRARSKVGSSFRGWAGWFKRPTYSLAASLERRLRAGLVPDPNTGCLLWNGAKKHRGYGHLSFAVHRLAWELAHGPIPDGVRVLHRCDTPACCNPDHLFLVNAVDNLADNLRKGRERNQHTVNLTATRQGHPQA